MPDEADPPRKFYGLKPTEFEVVNPPLGSPDARAPIDINELIRQGAAKRTVPKAAIPQAAPEAASPEHDVHSILRSNLARATDAGLNELTEKPRRSSKRKRDYLIVLGIGNAIFVSFGGWNIFSLAGVAFFSLSLTWVMWFVMDDY